MEFRRVLFRSLSGGRIGVEAEAAAQDKQWHFPFFSQQAVVGTVVVHAVVGCHQHLITGVEPGLQVNRQVDVGRAGAVAVLRGVERSEEHTSELQSLMRSSYAVFCLKKKKQDKH